MISEQSGKTEGRVRVLIFDRATLDGLTFKRSGDGMLFVPEEIEPEFDSGWCGNLVVNTGKQLTQNQVFGLTATPVTKSEVGDSSAVPTVGQTALQGGSTASQNFDSAPVLTGNVITCQSTFAGGSTAFQWLEAGMFTAGGVMLDRVIGFGDPTPGGSAAILAWTYTQN